MDVRTLNKTGKISQLTHTLKDYNWDIIGLAETRLIGEGEMITDEGQKIWFSGEKRYHERGVGFIVRKEMVKCVLGCTPSRVIMLRLAAKPFNITIIQVYAPTSTYSDEAVEEFYEKLDETIAKKPKKDLLIVLGDWNAMIGTDAHTDWPGTAGKYGCGVTNIRGQRLLEFADFHGLTIANTIFPHKMSRRYTWHSPHPGVHTQIDYILTPKKFKTSIFGARTRSFPGADIGSDHELVMTTLKIKLKKIHGGSPSRIKFDIDKLFDHAIRADFQAEIGGRFAALNLIDRDLDDVVHDFNEAITSSAMKTIGRKRLKRKPWVTDEVLALCDQRKELKKTKHQNAETREE